MVIPCKEALKRDHGPSYGKISPLFLEEEGTKG
jgi:hypothetical protein